MTYIKVKTNRLIGIKRAGKKYVLSFKNEGGYIIRFTDDGAVCTVYKDGVDYKVKLKNGEYQIVGGRP